MSKKAYLATYEVTVRVIVDENTTEDKIAEIGFDKAVRTMQHQGAWEHIAEVSEDTEVPYDKNDKTDNNPEYNKNF